jgi:hypothetical protein
MVLAMQFQQSITESLKLHTLQKEYLEILCHDIYNRTSEGYFFCILL